jgi:hypothetical protein
MGKGLEGLEGLFLLPSGRRGSDPQHCQNSTDQKRGLVSDWAIRHFFCEGDHWKAVLSITAIAASSTILVFIWRPCGMEQIVREAGKEYEAAKASLVRRYWVVMLHL